MSDKGSVLVVDDNVFVLDSTSILLTGYGFYVEPCEAPEEAIEKMRARDFEAVLTDIKMPRVSGIDLLERIKACNPDLPVILMTAYADLDLAVNAVKKGAFDFLIKPYNPDYLIHALDKAVKYYRLIQMEKSYKLMLEDEVKKRTRELADALNMVKDMTEEIAHRLTAVAEYRDTDTGAHIKRIGLYSGRLAEALGLPQEFIERITLASSMHDIGKIGIPDSILLKPGALTPEEYQVMKGHTVIGERMLCDSHHPSIQMAATIALAHHERWDGSGYPGGLKGDQTPVEGRIVMLVDQYDALRSKRPYKKALEHEEVIKIITEGDNRTMPAHFEPRLLDIFKEVAPEFDRIFRGNKD